MKVVSFLLALLLPAHVTGVTEQYVLPEDSLKVADTLGQNQVADSAPIGPMVPVGGGKPKNNLAAKCKVLATYLLFVKLSDLGWAADLYLPIGAVVGGLPVYSSANGDLVGYLAETIIIGGAGCVVSGSIRLLATGANGFNDNISFEGMFIMFVSAQRVRVASTTGTSSDGKMLDRARPFPLN